MSNVTAPSEQHYEVTMNQVGTSPEISETASVEVATIQSGIATKYWDECVTYPAGGVANLWVYVNGWKRLANPSQGIKDMVQRAFLGSGSNVRVWYNSSKVVVGLVVEGT